VQYKLPRLVEMGWGLCAGGLNSFLSVLVTEADRIAWRPEVALRRPPGTMCRPCCHRDHRLSCLLGLGDSETMASVVSMSPAIEAAFRRAMWVTLVWLSAACGWMSLAVFCWCVPASKNSTVASRI
jgi:hypothetical protein